MSSSFENRSSSLPKMSSSIKTLVDGGLSECLGGGVDTVDGVVSWAKVLIGCEGHCSWVGWCCGGIVVSRMVLNSV